MNTYGYVGGNPIAYSDSKGLWFGGGCWGGIGCIFVDKNSSHAFKTGIVSVATGTDASFIDNTEYYCPSCKAAGLQSTVSPVESLVLSSPLLNTASRLGKSCSGLSKKGVNKPELPIKGFDGSKGSNPYHALHRAISRGVSPNAILGTLKNPSVTLPQGGGRTLYLTKDAAVVLDNANKAVTIWGGAQHMGKTLDLLRSAGAL